jgi:CRP/FNR family transcriptional regulator
MSRDLLPVGRTAPDDTAADGALGLPVAVKCAGCGARRVGVCHAVPEADLDRLSAAAVAMTLAPGEQFIEEGESSEAFFTLIDGTAKLLKMMSDGRQQITSFAGRGDFLGLAVGQRYSYSAEALDRVRLCRFSRARLRRLIADFPEMETRLLEITSHELVLAQEQMLLLGCKSARERLASFLVARASKAGAGRRAPLPVSLPMTRRDIADYLGLSIETVSRTLTHLKVAGLIAPAPAAGIVIRDFPGLAALAAGI